MATQVNGSTQGLLRQVPGGEPGEEVSCEEVNRWERREDGEFGVETKAAFVRHSRVL